jgi:hypothetical protein
MPKAIQTSTTEKTATLPFLETKERIAAVLNDYLKQSKNGKEVVLLQQTPEHIAEELQLNTVFKNGFKDVKSLEGFVKTYLDHTNHLSNPKVYGTSGSRFPKTSRVYPIGYMGQ